MASLHESGKGGKVMSVYEASTGAEGDMGGQMPCSTHGRKLVRKQLCPQIPMSASEEGKGNKAGAGFPG